MAGEHEEYHEVVQLLLARMESHPEEFEATPTEGDLVSEHDRWWRVMDKVLDYGTKEEKDAIHAAMRKIKLNAAHEIMLDELLNGPERRAEAERDRTRYGSSIGASLRGAITPALQRIDAQMQQDMQQSQMAAIKNAYDVLKLTTTKKD